MTILTVSPGPLNELNETQPVEAPIQKIWCKITPIAGTERFVNAQNTADVTHEIRCRYVPYLNHTCKLQYDGVVYDLVSVLDVENQHIELLILAHQLIN